MFKFIGSLIGGLAAVVWKTVEFIFEIIIDFCTIIIEALTEILCDIADGIEEGWRAIMIRFASPTDIPAELMDTAYGEKIKRVIDKGGVMHLSGSYNIKSGKIGKLYKAVTAEQEAADVRGHYQDDIIIAD